jgi:hypothetical protein
MSANPTSLVNIAYPLETALKLIFIVMSPFNIPFTLLIAFLASLIGIFRVLKTPQFTKEYLAKVLQNNHGQNLLYISFGSVGFANYIYYSPIVLFFTYGIVEFIKIKFPENAFNRIGDLIRHNKFFIYEGKGRLEIFVFLYMLVTLPFDFMGRVIKVFLIGQYLFIKYRINAEFIYSCSTINQWILQKTYPIGFLNRSYSTVAAWIYQYANRDLNG